MNIDLSELIKDNKGSLSAMRLAMLIWLIGVFATWCFVSFQSNNLQAIPESVTTILGIVVSGKVVQRFGEKDKSITVTSSSATTT